LAKTSKATAPTATLKPVDCRARDCAAGAGSNEMDRLALGGSASDGSASDCSASVGTAGIGTTGSVTTEDGTTEDGTTKDSPAGDLAAQTRTRIKVMMKAIRVPRNPRKKAIVPRIFAVFRSPLSQALSERAEKRTAKKPKGQLHVPNSVNIARGKWEGGFSPRKFGGCTASMVGKSP